MSSLLGYREGRALGARLREGEQRREAVGRRPARVARVDEDLGVGREGSHLLQHLFERLVVERGRNGDDVGHVRRLIPGESRERGERLRAAKVITSLRSSAAVNFTTIDEIAGRQARLIVPRR